MERHSCLIWPKRRLYIQDIVSFRYVSLSLLYVGLSFGHEGLSLYYVNLLFRYVDLSLCYAIWHFDLWVYYYVMSSFHFVM